MLGIFPGLDFVTGWAARGGGRRLRFRAETQKAKLQEMAKEILDNYLNEAQSKPRDALVELQKASSTVKVCISDACRQMCILNARMGKLIIVPVEKMNRCFVDQ